MPRVVRSTVIEASDGRAYEVRICGRQRLDRRWDGWIEFAPTDASPVLRTPRETTQPTLGALNHWATGLTPVYLDGAFTRAVHATRVPHLKVVEPEMPFYDEPAPDPHVAAVEVVEVPSYDEPAPDPHVAAIEAAAATRRALRDPNDFFDVEGAVLDPISVYAKGEDYLRQRLAVLSADHLRRIARAYVLVSPDLDLEVLTEPALTELIVVGARGRCAA